MGISHFDFNVPPLHINPHSLDYISLIQELDHLPFSIVLTTSCSPFLIKFANKQWLALSGHELSDVLDKTFSVIQGKGIENTTTAVQFKNKVTASLHIWKLTLSMIVLSLVSPSFSKTFTRWGNIPNLNSHTLFSKSYPVPTV